MPISPVPPSLATQRRKDDAASHRVSRRARSSASCSASRHLSSSRWSLGGREGMRSASPMTSRISSTSSSVDEARHGVWGCVRRSCGAGELCVDVLCGVLLYGAPLGIFFESVDMRWRSSSTLSRGSLPGERGVAARERASVASAASSIMAGIGKDQRLCHLKHRKPASHRSSPLRRLVRENAERPRNGGHFLPDDSSSAGSGCVALVPFRTCTWAQQRVVPW